MDKNRPDLPPRSRVTIGDKYGYAMTITDAVEAADYFEACVQHNLSFGEHSRARAEDIERQNLGYYAGYCDHATRQRVERLFSCSHPIFGKAGADPVDPFVALRAGIEQVGTEAAT